MTAAYPLAPRVFAGIGGVAVGLYFGALTPGYLSGTGYPITALVMIATTVPLVLFLAMMALWPDALQRLLAKRTKLDLHDAGHGAAAIIIAATLYFVLGYGALTNGAFAYEHEVVLGEEATPIDGDALFTGIFLNVIILVLPPLFYVSFVTPGGPVQAFRALGLRTEGAGRAILVGSASAIGVLVVLALVSYGVQGLQVEIPENERALEIARSVTVLGAFGLAIGAAVSEEVFFRGFLQPRIGLIGQAALFAAAHLSYVNVLEVVVTFVLALIFGLIYRQTGNLLAPIAGHFLFNLLMLLAGIYAPESA